MARKKKEQPAVETAPQPEVAAATAPLAEGPRVRIKRDGSLQQECGRIVEEGEGGRVRVQLEAPCFAGDSLWLCQGEYEVL